MNGERPVTSKSRGICRYYNTPRGCYAGDKCKFLHGEVERLTPYDKNKTCRYYADGYCRHGANCWFKHIDPSPSSAAATAPSSGPEEEHLCCICYEKPVTYGLLAGCSHIFCVGCIREWRASNGKSEDMVASGVTKQCPLCRASSKFVTPSSQFFPESHPKKTLIIEQYKSSMARVPCRYFEQSSPNNRFCPFGKDCFFRHCNADGSLYVFADGVDHNMRVYRRRRDRERFANIRRFMDTAILDHDYDSLSDISEEQDLTEDGNLDIGSYLDDNLGIPARFMIDDAVRVEEILAILLDARVGNAPDAIDVHVRSASPVGTDETLVDTDSEYRAASANQSPVPVPVPEPRVATPPVPARDPEMQRPAHGRAASEPISRSRFSTVVDRRPRSISDQSSVAVDDDRPLPGSASNAVTAMPTDAISTQVGRVQVDEQVSREAEALLNEAPEFDRRVEDVMRSLEASELPPSPPAPFVEPPHEEARPPCPPCTDAVAEVVHDSEPPFLTDGRGRVVWSNMSAGRHRDGRRVRSATASVPTQQKGRRDAPDVDTTVARNAEDSAD